MSRQWGHPQSVLFRPGVHLPRVKAQGQHFGRVRRIAPIQTVDLTYFRLSIGQNAEVANDQSDRRSQVLTALRHSRLPLNDDEIARAISMNRHYVNAICRQLAAERLITRERGIDKKLVNMIAGPGHAELSATLHNTERVSPVMSRPWRRPSERSRGNIEQLVAGFADYVAFFEERQAFPGPSLYFHERAIELRRRHHTVGSLLDDERFLEYVYAVLPAWGMHRMGPQTAKVGDFSSITSALRETRSALEALWPLRITDLLAHEAKEAAETAWDIIAHINVSTSRTQIVAGSKFLHHLLPDLLPPMDRQYTFTFFTGQKAVSSDRLAFLVWFPQLADIGTRCGDPIRHAINRGGFMATGQAKVIDNAIMGFMQQPLVRAT